MLSPCKHNATLVEKTLANHKSFELVHIYHYKNIPEAGKIEKVSPLHSHPVPEKQLSFRILN
jgi:hypothetical protein